MSSEQEQELKTCPHESIVWYCTAGRYAPPEHYWSCEKCGMDFSDAIKSAIDARTFPSESDKKLLESIRDNMPQWLHAYAENGEHDSALVLEFWKPLQELIERLK